METIELKYDDINDRFKKILGDKINQSLLDAVYELLPHISAYKEEDKVFGFKIALGYDFKKNVNVETSCFFEIKRFSLTGEKDYENIQRLLKETVIFCSKNADLYIDQISETEITFGVFFTDYKHTGLLEGKILHSEALILEGFVNEGIRVLCDDVEERFFIRLSFSKNFDKHKYSANAFHWSDECRYWDGIFKKARKSVHGTICLIVKPDWKADDDNFVDEKVTEFEGLSIAYSNSANAEDLLRQQYSIKMFLSMLDYDGVTILDTDGRVRSYHNIVKIREPQTESGDPERQSQKTSGGARHKAFYSLKNTQDWKTRGYVGIYFQSQEGEIEYYDFPNTLSQDYFKSEVMNYGDDNPFLREVKEYYDNRYNVVDTNWKNLSSHPLVPAIIDLEKKHFEKDNFYHEVAPAQTLNNLLTGSWSTFKQDLQNNSGLLRRLLNVLIITYIGNSYSEAYHATPYIEQSINLIDVDLWKKYFDNYDFIYKKMLWELSYPSKNQVRRWESLVQILKTKGLHSITEKMLKDIQWRYRAIEFLESQNESGPSQKNYSE